MKQNCGTMAMFLQCWSRGCELMSNLFGDQTPELPACTQKLMFSGQQKACACGRKGVVCNVHEPRSCKWQRPPMPSPCDRLPDLRSRRTAGYLVDTLSVTANLSIPGTALARWDGPDARWDGAPQTGLHSLDARTALD